MNQLNYIFFKTAITIEVLQLETSFYLKRRGVGFIHSKRK